MNSKRDNLLTLVTAEVAENGEHTKHSIRILVENRISRQAWNKAANLGLRIYEKRQQVESEVTS